MAQGQETTTPDNRTSGIAKIRRNSPGQQVDRGAAKPRPELQKAAGRRSVQLSGGQLSGLQRGQHCAKATGQRGFGQVGVRLACALGITLRLGERQLEQLGLQGKLELA